ncbi:HSP20-like chaperone [Pholiota molesta]|nr:HSP20-like chaperone [Pholiota molesta]
MSAPPNHPYEPFLDFERFFDEAFNARVGGRASTSTNRALSAFKPRMDLHENPEANLVTVLLELPGVKKEDVDIEIQNGRLTVTAENKLPVEFEESGYAVREIKYGHFLRSLRLPAGVEAKDVTAIMESGILRLTFPQQVSGQDGSAQRVPLS